MSDCRTEHGPDDTGRYYLKQFLDGKLVLHVVAQSKGACLSAAKILTLHELVRRDDLREFGAHRPCDGCAFELEVTPPDGDLPF